MNIKRFKKAVKKIILKCVRIFPLLMLRRIAGQPLVIVNYHSIEAWDPDSRIRKNTYRSEKLFIEDLKFFKNSFNVIGMAEFLYFHRMNNALPKNTLLITIDDGLKVVYDRMYPLLKKEGLTAAVFINPAFIDNKDLHYIRKRNIILDYLDKNLIDFNSDVLDIISDFGLNRFESYQSIQNINYNKRELLNHLANAWQIDYVAYLNKQSPYLSSDEIMEMIQSGFTFGAHSMDHAPFNQITDKEQIRQIRESMKQVVENWHLDYRIFAFPSNDKNIRLSVMEKGVEFYEASFGVQGLRLDQAPNHFHRVEIESSSAIASTAIKYEYCKLIMYKLLAKLTLTRK